MDIASVLSASAASVAALLAGLNLVVSGRREDRRWARETATEAFVAFMHASFQTGAACRDAVRLRESGSDDDLGPLKRRIDDAHDAQMVSLTRLRLLSTAEVVVAADRLHDVGDELTTLSLDDGGEREIEQTRERLREARSQMVVAARQAMRVPDPGGTSQAGL